MTISLALHLLLLAILFLPSKHHSTHYEIASVELLSDSSHSQRPQKEQRKKTRKAKLGEGKVSPKEQAPPAEQDSEGQDDRNAREIKGSRDSLYTRAATSYGQELQRYIERHRFYPRRARLMEQTGTVKIRLVILKDGTFSQVEVTEPSEHPILDRAAYNLVTGLKKFKPLPSVYQGQGEFIVPIRYQLRGEVL